MRCAVVGTLVLLAACDNPPFPADTPDAAHTPDAASCVVRGTNVALKPLIHQCDETHLAPDCLSGVITLVTSPPDDLRLFEVELHGAIRIIEDGKLRPEPFLDLTAENGGPVNGVGVSEMGLLGLAFHPSYATNGTFYVFYTSDNPDTSDTQHPYLNVLASYQVDPTNRYRADPASGRVLMSILDEYSNHNAGMIEFGNDGLLYISTGDGGGDGSKAADYDNKAQNPNHKLGKILRIDVDRSDPGKEYAIPPGNPFGNETWVLGLRNPWRWSFDRATMNMWIGDVGQAAFEEIDMLRPDEQPGANLGWKMFEGNDCFEAPCTATNIHPPVEAKYHGLGWWAIIGGQVYRGSCYPDLVGTYLYTDCGFGVITLGTLHEDGTYTSEYSKAHTDFPTSLHADSRGELYLTDTLGNIFQIVVEPPAP